MCWPNSMIYVYMQYIFVFKYGITFICNVHVYGNITSHSHSLSLSLSLTLSHTLSRSLSPSHSLSLSLTLSHSLSQPFHISPFPLSKICKVELTFVYFRIDVTYTYQKHIPSTAEITEGHVDNLDSFIIYASWML